MNMPNLPMFLNDHPLCLLRDLTNSPYAFGAYGAHDVSEVLVRFKLYTRPADPDRVSGNDPKPPEYNERAEVTATLGEVLKWQSVTEMRSALGALVEEDVAMSNLLSDGDFHRYIPTMDFACSGMMSPGVLAQLRNIVGPVDMTLFSTGRSFHGYSGTLLTHKQWTMWLGEMLNLNTPNETVVDARWIGHSLHRAQSWLRLTCASSAYRSMPREYMLVSNASPFAGLREA